MWLQEFSGAEGEPSLRQQKITDANIILKSCINWRAQANTTNLTCLTKEYLPNSLHMQTLGQLFSCSGDSLQESHHPSSAHAPARVEVSCKMSPRSPIKQAASEGKGRWCNFFKLSHPQTGLVPSRCSWPSSPLIRTYKLSHPPLQQAM